MNTGHQWIESRQTLTMPLIPHAAAINSPQYLSLHHEIHHPPSAYEYAGNQVSRPFTERHKIVPRDYLNLAEIAIAPVAAAETRDARLERVKPYQGQMRSA